MKYRLGLIDHGFVPRKLTVAYVAICTGAIDIAVLRTAFGLLCDKYPMLRGTIAVSGSACWLQIPDDGTGSATIDILEGPIADWLARGITVVDPALGLAKLTIVRDGAQTAVALQVCHAINDASMGFALLEYFWHTAAMLSGSAGFLDPSPVQPRSLERAYDARALALPPPAVSAARPVHSLTSVDTGVDRGFAPTPAMRIALSRNDTAALLEHARASGTTLHALLSAAIIRAERATLAVPGTAAAELPMIMFHLVDLRPHLRPTVQRDEVTNALGFVPTVTAATPETDLGVLAKHAKEQIIDGIADGSALAVMLAAAEVAATGRARTGVGNFITNWGPVPALTVPAGVEIVDLRGFATSEAVSWVGYFVSTYADRAGLELAFSPRHHPRAQIARLRDLIAANLAELTHTPLS
ncbi:phthiocerol/phthiodiolone dimycocerosyl transferase family protein [Nocardia crassostreae]|uniref:phthiocerol/phthiodiolone dimycocerosyl transferase family protein n=1 Tax=Nocardia crassostreae TaxID=53428 RepID=UPI00082F26A3|nr:hypothetical protein [Nocardia crassostreae]